MNRPRFLDQRMVEFSGSYHDGWLVAPPGLCRSIGTLYPIASEDDPHCSICAKSPTFRAHLQGSGTNERSGIPTAACC
jgi:hypothetical protein